MTRFGPSVDDTSTVKDVESTDPWAVAAVPVPVLFRDAQAAMARGAWAEACALLGEVVWLEPGFEQDGHSARALFAQARRAHARATRRKRIIDPWPVLISVAALVLVPVAAGVATEAFGGAGPTGLAVLEPVPATVVTVATLIAAPSTVMPALPTALPAAPTELPVRPIVVPPLPTVAPATPTVERLAVPTVEPVPTPQPTVAELGAANVFLQFTLGAPTEQPPTATVPAPTPLATPEEDLLRQPPAKAAVTR